MAGSKNNPAARGTKQVNETVLCVSFGPGLKMHTRLIHDPVLAAEMAARASKIK